LILLLLDQRVARRKNVASVDANPKSFRLLHLFEKIGNLLKLVPQIGALTGGRLEPGLDFDLRQSPMDFIEGSDDRLQPQLFGRLYERSGMDHDAQKSQLFAPFQLDDERIDRFLP